MGPFDRGGAALRVRPHNGARPKMQIFVKNVNNETSTLDLESSASVLSVKQLLAARENISVEDQLLSFDGLTLDDDHPVRRRRPEGVHPVHLTETARWWQE